MLFAFNNVRNNTFQMHSITLETNVFQKLFHHSKVGSNENH